MASFAVHLAGGLVGSGLAATSVLAAGLATPTEMLAYLGLGVVGSLLPDIDADNSAPVQIAFNLISISLAFAAMFLFAEVFASTAELALVWLVTYLFFRWFVLALFTRLTTHRGILHSIPAAVLFGMTTSAVASHFLALADLQAWLAGLFVCFGYLLHLLLDELYSVNLFGMHTKRSFGTAMKLWSPSNHAASLYLYALCLLCWFATPDHSSFERVLQSPDTYARITQRLLPAAGWFKLN